jgi:hypothetical protein
MSFFRELYSLYQLAGPKSVQLIRDAYRADKYIAAFSQKDPDIEEPGPGDLHLTGTRRTDSKTA